VQLVVITLALLSAVFAAIYKFLPDKPIAWRDFAVGGGRDGAVVHDRQVAPGDRLVGQEFVDRGEHGRQQSASVITKLTTAISALAPGRSPQPSARAR